jgi:hypothetical protein
LEYHFRYGLETVFIGRVPGLDVETWESIRPTPHRSRLQNYLPAELPP